MKLFSAILFTALASTSIAQTLVGTNPTTKTAILEEFTGVNCPNCPPGHVIANDILADYPGQAIVLGYHPVNSSYTTPQNSTDEDFRRSYLDDFYSSAYIGSRFMPGGMINRREWPLEKNTSRGDWDAHVQTIIAETSPVNVGVSSTYDASANTLTVDVEVYYTSAVTNPNTIYVHIIEDNLLAEQSGSGGGVGYMHNHVFRDELNAAQWGDPIATTTMGSLFTTQYVFDLSTATAPIDVDEAHIVAFVYDATSEEISSGAEVVANGGATVSIDDVDILSNAKVYPNPTSGPTSLAISSTQNVNATISIVDILGKTVANFNQKLISGQNTLTLNNNDDLTSGIYFVNVNYGKDQQSLKLIVK